MIKNWFGNTTGVADELRCPRDGFQNSPINMVCAKDDCDESLVRWPAWFSNKLNRQLIVNFLRSLALIVGLGLGPFELHWALLPYTFLLTSIMLLIMLRAYPGARARTCVIGAIGFALIGISRFYDLLPITTNQIQFVGLPALLLILYIVDTLLFQTALFRTERRVGYFPFFPTIIGIVIGLLLLKFLVRWQAEALEAVIDALLPLAVGGALSGLLIGGLIAGIAKRLPRLAASAHRGPHIRRWQPRRIAFSHRTYSGPVAIRSLVRALLHFQYVLTVSLQSAVIRLVNNMIRFCNRIIDACFTLINTIITASRRFIRRLGNIAAETALVFIDGCRAVYNIVHSYFTRIAWPLILIIVMASAGADLSQVAWEYIWGGSLFLLARILFDLLVVGITLGGLVSVQTSIPLLPSLEALVSGLIEPAIGGLLVFILVSFGLSFSDHIFPSSPYRIGPLTIAACALLVGAIVYSLVRSDGQEQEEGQAQAERHSTSVRTGPVVAVQPAIAGFALVVGVMVAASLAPTSIQSGVLGINEVRVRPASEGIQSISDMEDLDESDEDESSDVVEVDG